MPPKTGSPAPKPKAAPKPPPSRVSRAVKASRPVARRGVREARQVSRGSSEHLVMAEFLIAVAVIGLRAVGQYEPRGQGTRRGVIVPSPGKLGPLPMLAATIIFYFILSFLAIGGGARARVAVVAGLIYDLAMLMNSAGEMSKLTGLLSELGQGKQSPGGGPGPGTGAYQSALSGTAAPASGHKYKPVSGPAGAVGVVKAGPGKTCPPGYKYSGGECLPPALQGSGTPET